VAVAKDYQGTDQRKHRRNPLWDQIADMRDQRRRLDPETHRKTEARRTSHL
jgi:hypothetical protein